MSDWLYNSLPITENDIDGFLGFVYIITNNITNKKYIGKKLLKFSRKKSVKGKKNKKRVLIDSDWKTYYGSNKELAEDVVKYGEESFTREILKLCVTKGDCSYWEAKLQFENDVLISDQYYNSWIMCKIHKSHIKNISAATQQ